MTASAPRALGANYRKLFGASTASNLGDGLMQVALLWLASTLSRDPVVIALIGVAGRLPWLLFSLPAGVITDRVDRRRLVAWMDVVRLVVVAALGLLVLSQQAALPTPEQLAAGASPPAAAPLLLTALGVAALALGSAEVLRDNAAQTLMPSLVRPDQLEKANARLWGVENTMNQFVGPPLAGVLVAVAISAPILINAGLLAVSATLVFALVGRFEPKPTGVPAAQRSWRGELAEGFGWLWRHDLVRALAISLGVLNMMSNIALTTMVLFVQDVLGLFEGWMFGLVTTGFAVGALLASLVADRITARLRPGITLMVALLGSSATMAAMGLAPNAVVFWLASVASGVTIVLWNVVTVSLRQRLIPDHLLGRVNSCYRFFGWGTISIGTLLGGVLVAWGEPLLGREEALRAVMVVGAVGQLALIGYVRRHASTARIREAEQRAAAVGGDA